MKPAPCLRLEPRSSRIGGAGLTASCAATMLLVVMLPLPFAASLGGVAAVLAVLAAGLRRCAGRGVPAVVDVGIDRRITVTDRGGRSRAGSILDDSYVGAWVTTVIWRADGDAWWRPARAMLVLPDTLPREDFRRLRVVLRYGRPATVDATSGADAG